MLSYTSDPKADFEAVLHIYKNSKNLTEKTAALEGLGAVNDITLLRKLLFEIMMDSDIVKNQDISYPFAGIEYSRLDGAIALKWEWFTTGFKVLVKRLPSNMIPTNHVLRRQVGSEEAAKIKEWYEGASIPDQQAKQEWKTLTQAIKREVDLGLERISIATLWFERDEQTIYDWLLKNRGQL